MLQEDKEKIIKFLAENSKSIEDVQSLLKELVWPTLETLLQAEMEHHLWYEKHSKKGYNTWNSRNWSYKKKVFTSIWEENINIPRDRNSDFEPQILPKYESRTTEFDQKIINMYWLWLSTRDIQNHIKDMYWCDISPTMISAITDKVVPAIREWQARPLDKCYPIIFLDAIHFKVKQDWKYVNKAVYIVIWISILWFKDILGLYIWENESASFWQMVCNNLANRWVEDVFIACVDGLNGFSKAIKNIFPNIEIQRCIIHQIRYTMNYINRKDSKEFMADLKNIYKATDIEIAQSNLELLEEKRGKKYSISVRSWKENWPELSTYFVYPDNIRKIIYTTNIIEWFNRQVRKYTKNRNVFSTDDSLLKILYLVSQNITRKREWAVWNWWEILSQFEAFFPSRVEKYIR